MTKSLALFTRRFGLWILLGAFSAGCAGTFKEVKPTTLNAPPSSRPTALACGKVQITDARLSEEEKATMLNAFKLGMKKWSTEHKAFSFVSLASDTNAAPPQSMILNGTIHEVEKGSAAARFWVGMGAGQARVQGDFFLASSDGQTLVRFTARKSYLGGLGAGGMSMLKTDELVGQLGELTAETTDKWLKGQKID